MGDDPYANAGTGSNYGQEDTYDGYTASTVNPLDSMDSLYGVNPSAVAPMFGMHGVSQEPEYLDYSITGKGWAERMSFNTGASYLMGLTAGGAVGLVEGYRTSPSKKWRIRLNSVLNKCGRRGSRFGNAVGMLALMYSCFEYGADTMEVEKYLGGSDIINPVLAATSTGLLFKCTQGPRTMVVAGVLGGGLAASVSAARVAGLLTTAPVGLMFF